ncbi:MAG: helicase [Deltaproteobacteria bacterium HGW-Deltaproteobacteria-14]|nr:MAG: helicase [Deltaproteobacteria bacterium HGW-Deltaproteobacteria-14]
MLDDLFQAIRESVSAADWSAGVGLARDGLVTLEREEDDELTLRVVAASKRRSFEVTLWPEDEEWQCDCPGGDDCCGHVAAAIIALRQAKKEGASLQRSKDALGRLVYVFRRSGDSIALQRMMELEGKAQPWNQGLATDGQAPIITSQADLMAERALGTWRHGVVPATSMAQLLEAVAGCERVTLDGLELKASGEPVTPRAVVSDDGDGFTVRLVVDPGVTELFRNRAVLCDGVLRPVGDGGLGERDLRELPRGRYYRPEDVTELAGRVIAELKKRVPVQIETKRLPTGKAEPPRVIVEVSDEDDQLTVFPTLVYGDPPTARVDRGHLVLLGGALPIRDPRTEDHLTARLARGLGLEPGRKAHFSGEEAVAFVSRLERFQGGEIVGTAHEDYYLAAPLVPEVELDDEGHVTLRFESDDAPADPARVMRAWRKGLQLAPLEGGGWAPLPRDWLRRYGHAIEGLLRAKDAQGELPPSALGDMAQLCEALDRPLPPRFARLKALLGDFTGIPEAPAPADLTATLRHYQQAGLDWLTFLRGAGLGGLLADDMGLGKTLQALCAVRGRTLVVAPTSVLFNWAEEAAKFRPSLKVATYHGPRRALDPDADVTLTTWALLRLDSEALSAVDWDMVVLDEAQAMKNPDSQVAQAAYRLRAGFRLTLTGTPVENRLDDLWSQIHFSNPGLLGGRSDFVERYADPIAAGDRQAALRLRERVRPFILRRMKREVAPELPPRTDVVLHCEMSAAERDVYEAIRAATQKEVVAALQGGGSVIAALEALLRLRQAACHPGLIPGQQAETSSKIALLLEVLEEAASEGHKALVFSQWTSLLDLVEPHLTAAGLDFVRLDGSTRDRGAVVNAFQSDDGPPVMLLSLKAGGTGLNLTAADHVMLLDPWWNPAVEDQAADRAHRIGQERPVVVHRLVSQDTVEERILGLQAKKRALAEAAVGDASQAASITRDDLLALLA